MDYCCVVMRGFEVKLKMIRLDLIKKKGHRLQAAFYQSFTQWIVFSADVIVKEGTGHHPNDTE